MAELTTSRRSLILAAGVSVATGLAFGGCGRQEEKEGRATANEDLMREHGVVRRTLLVYAEASRRARDDPSLIPLASLKDAARLFRQFAEDYHERALEEQHIFPVVRKLKSPASQLPDVLLTQHLRGREITDYIQAIAARGRIATGEADRFADTLDSFIAMYGAHAAREDTVLLPVWKMALGTKGYEEMGDQFEDLEHKMLGDEGFQGALDRIAMVEAAFGLADLAAFTLPGPPAALRNNQGLNSGVAPPSQQVALPARASI